MSEPIPSHLANLALLKEIQVAMLKMNESLGYVKNELEIIRRNQEMNEVHLKFEVDLGIVHTNEEIADFAKMGLEVNSLTILRLPSAMSIRLTGLTGEKIDLEAGESINVTNHEITRLLVTNEEGSGIARIHVFGRFK